MLIIEKKLILTNIEHPSNKGAFRKIFMWKMPLLDWASYLLTCQKPHGQLGKKLLKGYYLMLK